MCAGMSHVTYDVCCSQVASARVKVASAVRGLSGNSWLVCASVDAVVYVVRGDA